MKKISLIALVLTVIALTALLFSCGKCDHEWNEGVISREPTCTANGITIYTCTKCDETKKIATDPAPHTNTEIDYIGATCTRPGEITLLCSVCNTTTKEQIPARPHAYSVRVSSTAATCSLPGKAVYKCATCSATNEVETPATGNHDFYTTDTYVMIKTVPTETTVGEKVTHCKTCTLEQVQPYYYSDEDRGQVRGA